LLSSLRGLSRNPTTLLFRTLARRLTAAFHARHLSLYATVWMEVHE
jgi:hypothetical protein